MTKFEKIMTDLFGRIDKIDEALKTKPPAPAKKETGDLKLLREHYDNLFNDIRTEFNSLKDEITEPRKQIEGPGKMGGLLKFFLEP